MPLSSDDEAQVHEIAERMMNQFVDNLLAEIHAVSIGGEADHDQTAVSRAELRLVVARARVQA